MPGRRTTLLVTGALLLFTEDARTEPERAPPRVEATQEQGRKLLLRFQLGGEYGAYFGSLHYDHTMRSPTSAVRLAGSVRFEETATLGLRGAAAIGTQSRSGFFTFEGGAALGVFEIEAVTETNEAQPGAFRVIADPYALDLQVGGRLGMLHGILYLESFTGLHGLFDTVHLSSANLDGRQFVTHWALGYRLEAGVRIPIVDGWYVGWSGGGSIMARRLPFFLRRHAQLVVGLEQEIGK